MPYVMCIYRFYATNRPYQLYTIYLCICEGLENLRVQKAGTGNLFIA